MSTLTHTYVYAFRKIGMPLLLLLLVKIIRSVGQHDDGVSPRVELRRSKVWRRRMLSRHPGSDGAPSQRDLCRTVCKGVRVKMGLEPMTYA